MTLALAAALAGCTSFQSLGGGSDEASGAANGGGQKRQAIKAALLLPLSSSQPHAGAAAKALKQAGELALFEFDNPNVRLLPKDTHGTPEGARAAAQDAIREGCELIIGPLYANEVAAVAPEAQRAGVPVLAFSSDQKVAGNGVYLMSFLAGSDVDRIIGYAASQGKGRIAALIPDTEYGRIVEQNLTQAANRHHVQIVTMQKYPADASGMKESVKPIAALARRGQPQIDAVFLPASQDALATLAPLLSSQIDPGVKLLGSTGWWDYASAGKEGSLEGAWFPAPDPKGWRDFAKRYTDSYNDSPPRLASLAYDAVSLAVSLSNNPPGQRYTRAELTRASGFTGVDGVFRLRPDGASERRFAILQAQRSGAEVADPAPTSFSTAHY